MKKLHLAIATQDIAATVKDYSDRLDTLNISVRQDNNFAAGGNPGT